MWRPTDIFFANNCNSIANRIPKFCFILQYLINSSLGYYMLNPKIEQGGNYLELFKLILVVSARVELLSQQLAMTKSGISAVFKIDNNFILEQV